MGFMEADTRPAGRKRDPRTEVSAIEAVLDLVAAGATLSGLSLVTIAEHAGVSRNSLYRRWKTKDELYLDVLDAINRQLPESAGQTARDDLIAQLAILIERTMDKRASSMLRALLAEAGAFPELHRRYFEQIVAPRREVMLRIIRRGIATGEIRPDADVALINEMLVGPILARMGSGATEDLDPRETSRRITDLIYEGIRARLARVVFSRQEPVRSWSCRADEGIRLEAWDTFAEICGGASATLTGLLFVAVSIRIAFIARSQELRSRAAQTLGLFGIVLMISVLIAIPGQAYRTLGAELVVLAVVTGTGLYILDRRAKGEKSDQVIAPVLEAVTPTTITSLLLLAAGIVLVLGVHAGLYVLVGPVFVALVGGVTSAWLFLTKITE
jgi:AcrR family transcriptional regulator